jgi:hypothetical protein
LVDPGEGVVRVEIGQHPFMGTSGSQGV